MTNRILFLGALLAGTASRLWAADVFFLGIPAEVYTGELYGVTVANQGDFGTNACSVFLYKGGPAGTLLGSDGQQEWAEVYAETTDSTPQTVQYFADGYDDFGYDYAYASVIVTEPPPPPTPAEVVFSGGPTFTYDGTPKGVTAVTNPANLAIYQADTWSATAIGNYTATGYIDTPGYTGGATYHWSIVGSTEPEGTGFTGTYHALLPASRTFGAQLLTRLDPTVNFQWGAGSPGAGVGVDNFAVRWTGRVRALETQTHTFETVSDDGVRLWVNDQLLIDNWTEHPATTDTGTIALTAGERYDIVMEYYEKGNLAAAELRWSTPNMAPQIIPAANLYPVQPAVVSFTFSGGPFTGDGTEKTVTVGVSPAGATYTATGTWSATAPGTYVAFVHANGNYTGTASYTWTINPPAAGPWVNEPFPDTGVLPAATPPLSGSLVGAIPGSVTVDNRGAANYSLPLAVPPGLGGLQPDLSVTYHSQGGNGLMGSGFTLSGLSAITRGRNLLARDGNAKGVDFTDGDKLYLDGRRLILVGGAYLKSGSSYRTEVEGFSRIEAQGPAGQDAETFTVSTKDGRIMTYGLYGAETDALQSLGAIPGQLVKTHTWALKHIADPVGHTEIFRYTGLLDATGARTGEYLLDHVEYAADSTRPAAARVQFGYEERSDRTERYLGNYAIPQTRRLYKVEPAARDGGQWTPVRLYGFKYEQAPLSGVSRLKTIIAQAKESVGGSWQDLPSTTLAWRDYADYAAARPVPVTGLATGAALPGFASASLPTSVRQFGDFNGDGRDDFVDAATPNTGIKVYLSHGTGFDDPVTWLGAQAAIQTVGIVHNCQYLYVGDLNGDGRQDIVWANNAFTRFHCAYSTGNGFAAPVLLLDDIHLFDDNHGSSTVRQAARENIINYLSVADFTGDGRADILFHTFSGSSLPGFPNQIRGTLRIMKSTDTGFAPPEIWVGNISAPWTLVTGWMGFNIGQAAGGLFQVHPLLGDYNGDGITDYAWLESSLAAEVQEISLAGTIRAEDRVWVALANPNGGFQAPWQVNYHEIWDPSAPPLSQMLHYVFPGDYNGDGITDLLIFGSPSPGNAPFWRLYQFSGQNPAYIAPDPVPPNWGGPIPINYKVINHPLPTSFVSNGATVMTHYQPIAPDFWAGRDANGYYLPGTVLSDVGHFVQNTPAELLYRMLGKLDSFRGNNMRVGDFNHDGLTDYAWFAGPEYNEAGTEYNHETGWWVAHSNGHGGFAPAVRLLTEAQADFGGYGEWARGVTAAASTVSFTPVDINGDGLEDWVVQDDQTFARHYSLGISPRGDLLQSVTDGLGFTTQFDYRPVTDDSIYTPGVAVTYPIRESRSGATYVVSQLQKDAGGPAQQTFAYQYSGNRLDLSGRGSLGFHSFVTLDTQTNLFKYQFLAQSFPMTGLTHREETYRWWNTGGQDQFRFLSSHDNTVVFDKVATSGGATLWPFIAKAVESRWEDAATAHFGFSAAALNSQPENLFPQAKPAGAHITITALSTFDDQGSPQLTLPGVSGYNPSDTNGSGQNTAAGTTSFATFSGLPGNITHGNLTNLTTDYGSGFTESVATTYKTGGSLTGLVDTVTTTVTSPGYGSETAPIRRYNYWGATPLVADETIDATDNALDLKTTYTRDSRGRITNTQITNTAATGAQAIGDYSVSSATGFDDRFDLPTTTRNAAPYLHATTLVYHPFLGLPASVTDVNGAQVTTAYDALGRATLVTDVLQNRATATVFAWDTSQTVAPPAGVTGVALTSTYKVTTTTTVQPTVTAYHDRLGRVIRTVKTGFNDQQTVTDNVYNHLGQLVATSLPYPAGGSPLWTRTTYDSLGRVATVIAPNGTLTTNTYSGRATAVSVDAPNLGGVDPAAQVNTMVVDAKGRTVGVWNADNVPAFTDTLGATATGPSIAFAIDGFGRMRTTTLKGQTQTITATYDALGRQLTLDDPDKGLWTYLNNALGQIVTQTDARGNVTTSAFDQLGRPLSRTTAGNGSTETAGFYYYDTDAAKPNTVAKGAQGWIGVPEREEISATGSFPATNLHYYNAKGLPSLNLTQTDGKWFYTYSDYDTYSRVRQVRHYWKPSGAELPSQQPYLWQDFGYIYSYDAKSYLLSLTDSLGRSWWDTPSYDYLDRVISVRKGGGPITTRTYRPEDGVLTAINTGGSQIQDLTFGFDALGNLTSRADGIVAGGETLTYDNLNRLKTSRQGTMNYADNGNLLSKPDVNGTTVTINAYDSARPHAVSQYTFNGQITNLTYDANGNVLTRTGGGATWSMNWTGFDKPRWMAKTTGGTSVGSEFHYNANRSRVMQLEFDSMSGGTPLHYNRKRIYALGSTLELNYNNTITSGSGQNWALDTVRIYVPGPDGIIGAREFRPVAGGTEKALVYHYDHLGSITAITDFGASSVSVATGNKTGRYSEDAWGQRRNPLTWSGAPTAATDDGGFDSLTPRGFTGHEMLDDLGLVHMNGRIYDPLLGRFLSPDGIVQFADDLQSYNRFSYVRNNPLTKFDPTGWYERDFHYGAVYYIMRARGYSAFDSNRIAGFSQYVDNNSDTEPIRTSAGNRAEHHFIGSTEDSATVRNNPEARSRVEDAFGSYGRGEAGSVYRLGDALHGLADTFSHEGFTAWHSDTINTRTGSARTNIGHYDAPEGGHAPDRPYNDADKAIAAAKAIYDLTPGAPGSEKHQRSWTDVEKSLRAGFSYDPKEKDADKSETKRADNMSKIIKKDFGDDAKYNEKDFAKESSQFEAAMKQQEEERRRRERK